MQGAGFDRVGGAAGQYLLGGLEEQPYGARQGAGAGQLGQHQTGAEDDDGVHVMAAGVGAAGDRGGVVDGLGVRDGQRVDVRAQCQQGAVGGGRDGPSVGRGVPCADVTDQAGAGGQYPGRRPARSSRSLIAAVVRNSWLPSSGCRCKSRRKALSSARSASGRAPGS